MLEVPVAQPGAVEPQPFPELDHLEGDGVSATGVGRVEQPDGEEPEPPQRAVVGELGTHGGTLVAAYPEGVGWWSRWLRGTDAVLIDVEPSGPPVPDRDVLRRVAAEAPTWLAPGGTLLVETGEPQQETALTALRAAGLDASVRTDDDLGALVVLGSRRGRPDRRRR